MATPSIVHGRRSARSIAPVVLDARDVTQAATQALAAVGLHLPQAYIRDSFRALVGDSNDVAPNGPSIAGVTTPSMATAIQFLQAWLPGFVRVATAARKIDDLIGVNTVGAWEDEEVVQGVLEPIGGAQVYTDHANVPLASWNVNFERRTVVRFEQGFEVGSLEEARAARMRVSTAAEKRSSSALALDIQRNRVGFYGYNDGDNRTYGFLNDPALSAYVTVPAGTGGGTGWNTKTFTEICTDLRVALARLRVNSKDVVDPSSTPITLAVASSAVDYLSTTGEYGQVSVVDWLKKNYPNVRIVSAPELNDANGGVAVFYLYADKVDDGASDDSATFVQVVPARFMALGVEKRAKGYLEDFANATAGTMVKRPFACVRYSGIVS